MDFSDFVRILNNFYRSKGLILTPEQAAFNVELANHFSEKSPEEKKSVALVFICLNPLYWEYVYEMVRGARNFFLPGHDLNFYFWTDIPTDAGEMRHKIKTAWLQVPDKNIQLEDPTVSARIETIVTGLAELMKDTSIHFIPTESMQWPYPTLLRYNLFLQQEQELSKYDYIFYCDVDMQFVGYVGDDILPKNGITAALHPMYAIEKKYWPPYEPNKESASYIPRPGMIISEDGKERFMPMYFAGGVQGGVSASFIEAMKCCKVIIEKDLDRGYIPIWNDESAWNKYLTDNPPEIVLPPSYVYPDSLIEEYYKPLWGTDYPPKIKTITKWFSISKEGGSAINKMLKK